MKKLVFDVTDANTILDSDSVGAFVRSSDGTLIDHATINSINRLAVDATMKDGAGNALSSTGGALDVNMVNSISLDVILNHTNDSVRLGDGTSFFTSTTVGADLGLDVNLINSNISVVQDSSSNPWVIGDGGGSITVDATSFDIRPLSSSTDSVSALLSDGAGNALTSTSGALDVNIASTVPLTINDAALANTAIATSVKTLTAANTPESIVTSALANRKYLFIRNHDNRALEIGPTGFTPGQGWLIHSEEYLVLRAGASVGIDFSAPKTGHKIRVMELS